MNTQPSMDTGLQEPQEAQPEELGPAIHVEEAAKSAKSSCSRCYGQGTITKVYKVRAPEGIKDLRIPKLCSCATRRFFKVNKDRVVWSKAGQLHWKAGHAA